MISPFSSLAFWVPAWEHLVELLSLSNPPGSHPPRKPGSCARLPEPPEPSGLSTRWAGCRLSSPSPAPGSPRARARARHSPEAVPVGLRPLS